MDPELKRELSRLMHESRMRSLFCRKIQDRYSRFSRTVLIAQGIAASTAVGGWALWSYQIGWFKMQWVAGGFLGLVAVLSIAYPSLNWPVIITASRIASSGWGRLNKELESLWIARKSKSNEEMGRLIREHSFQELWLNEIEAELPTDVNLGKECYNEAIRYYQKKE